MADDQFWRREPVRGPRPAMGGIRARSRRGDIGETWWSRRFISILESFGFGSRLDRGRHYARRGQVLDLEVHRGVVQARVQGSRARPYRVRLGVETLDEHDWARAEQAMAAKAVFAARLLAGEMPRDIEETFAACRLSLFPTSAGQLASSCTCPDWVSPCKHVAAVFYLLAEAFDRDPFLVFTWRGRPREELLARLRALRSPEGAAEPEAAGDAGGEEARRSLESSLDRFWEAGPELEEVRTRPWTAEAPDAAIRRLGPVGVTVRGADLSDLLAAACRTLAAAAQRRALGD
ncbi:MAG TPA: SWIM zinc finger family protein [Candidatus Dormibacteraeota bacterium]|nr:SWIM zinc finger family protein [Candidatus Dormibacteraeota bacterium]